MTLSVNFDTQSSKAKPKSKTTIRQTNPVIGGWLNGGAKVNGVIEHFEQGEKAGDCRALSQLLGLSFTPIGQKAIKDSVKSDGMGGAIVTFKGAKGKQKEFRISIEEFNRYEKGKIYSKGDDDVLCIEIAMVKYLKSLGIKVPDNGIHGHEVVQLGENELVGLLIGDTVKIYDSFRGSSPDNIDLKRYLAEFEKNPDDYVCEIGFNDFYSTEVYPAHAYALKRIENKNNNKYIVLINPYNSKKEIEIEYKKFLSIAFNVRLYNLTGKDNNRNLKTFDDRKTEQWENEEAEFDLSSTYQVLASKIKWAKTDDLKQYINDLSDLQRYFMMKHDAKRYIDMLDNRYMGWSSENIQNKKDVIQPFINSTVEHAKLYGVSENDINEFKNACTKELNARFYTNQGKIIEAFEKFIKIIENAKEEYYH